LLEDTVTEKEKRVMVLKKERLVLDDFLIKKKRERIRESWEKIENVL
jgi:hypothetical protein